MADFESEGGVNIPVSPDISPMSSGEQQPSFIITQVFVGEGRAFLEQLAGAELETPQEGILEQPSPILEETPLPVLEPVQTLEEKPAIDLQDALPDNQEPLSPLDFQMGLLEQRAKQLMDEIARNPKKANELLTTVQQLAKLLESVIDDQKKKETPLQQFAPHRPSERRTAIPPKKPLETRLTQLFTLLNSIPEPGKQGR